MNYPHYQEISPLNGDVDIRKEVRKIIYGDDQNRPYGTWAVLRKLQRDSLGEPIMSENTDFITQEPDLLNMPEGVTPEGYLYKDKIIRIGWSLGRILFQDVDFYQSGMQQTKKIRGYFTYEDRPEELDQIFMLETTDQGDPVNPLRFTERFVIGTVFPHTADMGRVEFWVGLLERFSHRRPA